MTAALVAVCLACLIAGEAGGCDTRSMIAVAHVAANREAAGIHGGWYGYAAPTPLQERIAREWTTFTDPTHGAIALWSTQDKESPAVQALAASMIETYTSAACANGQRLHAFKKRGTP